MFKVLSCIIASKAISTASPYIFKKSIDLSENIQHDIDCTVEKLESPKPNSEPFWTKLKDTFVDSRSFLVIGLGTLYVSRFATTYLNETRNIIVQKLAQPLTVSYCSSLLQRTLPVPPVFIKQVERARKGYKSMFTIKYTHIIPVSIELSMASFFVCMNTGYIPASIMLGSVFIYIYRSIWLTNQRVKERYDLIQVENSIYENTTQECTQKFVHLSQKEIIMTESLKKLNLEQQSILTCGSIIMLLYWWTNPLLQVSDMLMLQMLSQQLFQPLNNIGMIYREWVQSKQDMLEIQDKK